MAEAAFGETLALESARYGLVLPRRATDRFAAHFDLLVTWNRKLNLTRVIEPIEAARFHFLESAQLASVLSNPEDRTPRVLDVGSGAGFPGVPLACLWESCDFVLIEPHGKRAVFLKEVVRRLELPRVTVLNERFSSEFVRESDLLVSRALDGLDQHLDSLMTSAAAGVVLYTDPTMLVKAAALSPERRLQVVAIPGTDTRRIGIFT